MEAGKSGFGGLGKAPILRWSETDAKILLVQAQNGDELDRIEEAADGPKPQGSGHPGDEPSQGRSGSDASPDEPGEHGDGEVEVGAKEACDGGQCCAGQQEASGAVGVVKSCIGEGDASRQPG